MGIVSISLSQNNNMKFLLVVAVAAYVKAGADPAFVYSTAGVVPSVYTHGVLPYAVHHPLVYAAPLAAGCQNDQGKLVPCANGALPLVAGVAPAAAEPEEAVVSVEKREAEPTAEADAEADPEADPWLLYSGYHGYGYGHYAPFTYSYAPMSTLMPTPTMDSHMPTTMARDLLMLSQRLMLMLMLMLGMDIMDMD